MNADAHPREGHEASIRIKRPCPAAIIIREESRRGKIVHGMPGRKREAAAAAHEQADMFQNHLPVDDVAWPRACEQCLQDVIVQLVAHINEGDEEKSGSPALLPSF